MRWAISCATFLIAALLLIAESPARASAACSTAGTGERLVYDDEFNGAANSQPGWATSKHGGWVADVGNWGSDAYFSGHEPDNLFENGQGDLVFQAIPQPRQISGSLTGYDSAQIETSGPIGTVNGVPDQPTPSLRCPYGEYEARIQMPAAKGFWPAFWLVGDPQRGVPGATRYNCWPPCGEIDATEVLTSDPTLTYGTVHGPVLDEPLARLSWTASPTNIVAEAIDRPPLSDLENHTVSRRTQLGEVKLNNAGNLAGDFHTYAVEWTPTSITWRVDGVPYGTISEPDSVEAANGGEVGGLWPTGGVWAFTHTFHVMLDLAVGKPGGWTPDNGVPNVPASGATGRMLVDWVRVYQGG